MPRPVGGGDINAAWRIRTEQNAVFLKTGPATSYDMFLAEAEGLQELAQAAAVRVPRVLGCIVSGSEAVLALEWLDFEPADATSERLLGEQLAALHRHREERFGWHRDNTIGSTPQINDWKDNWINFWSEHRLGYQLELAAARGIGSAAIKTGEKLQERLGDYFQDYQPEASLLHGDLWSGNYGFLPNGEAVIFDPATYYGDREADMAMTELFGGFGGEFYAGYNASWPLDAGYKIRKTLYNAYHILNHFNMFGGGYGSQAESMMGRLLAEVS